MCPWQQAMQIISIDMAAGISKPQLEWDTWQFLVNETVFLRLMRSFHETHEVKAHGKILSL